MIINLENILAILILIFLLITMFLGILLHTGKPVFNYHRASAMITLICAIAYFILRII